MIVLHRPALPNRPKKVRLNTPGGWVDVKRELVGTTLTEIVKTKKSGAARALVVAHGFSIYETSPVPETEPTAAHSAPKANATLPESSPTASAPVDPGATPPSAQGAAFGGVTALTVEEIEEAVSGLDADQIALAIIEERAGKARKGALRALGVDI